MKKFITLIALLMIAATMSFAGGFDLHLGFGYHSSYVGSIPGSFGDGAEEVKAMPLGIGGYLGLGYGFGDKKIVNIGVELAPSWDFALLPPGVSNFAFQGRTYLKIKPIELLTLTAFGGFQGNLSGNFEDPASFTGYPVLGARISVFFIYAEYTAVLPGLVSGDTGIAKHEIGVGLALLR